MTWNDITISQFKQIAQMAKEDYEEIIYFVKLLAIVTNTPEEQIMNTPIDELKTHAKKLAFLNEKIQPRLPEKKYKINNKTYKLTASAKKMTAGQYIDYVNTLNNDAENLALLCAILLIPEGKTYGEDYEIQELAQEFEHHFKMVDVMGISFFFRVASKCYTEVMLTYLTKKLQKEKKKMIKKKENPEKIQALEEAINHITKSGLGISQSNKL